MQSSSRILRYGELLPITPEGVAVGITPDMIAAGLEAYRNSASHDQYSDDEPEHTVEAIIRAALTAKQ